MLVNLKAETVKYIDTKSLLIWRVSRQLLLCIYSVVVCSAVGIVSKFKSWKDSVTVVHVINSRSSLIPLLNRVLLSFMLKLRRFINLSTKEKQKMYVYSCFIVCAFKQDSNQETPTALKSLSQTWHFVQRAVKQTLLVQNNARNTPRR
jgi:hypothetical protein